MDNRFVRLISVLILLAAALVPAPTSQAAGEFAYSAALQTSGTTLYLPVILHPSEGVVVPPPDEASERISVPDGFEIRIFATSVPGPRLMAVGPDGELYVALRSSGQIARLPDRNNDGLSDGTEIAASGLSGPHNLEFRDGFMYVAETTRISRLSDGNGDGVYTNRQTVVSVNLGTGGHSTRTLHFGPDGNLYYAAGSASNNSPESDPRRAAILRFTPEGDIPNDNPFAGDADPRKRAVWAYGLRNSVDFFWTTSGRLWATHNGSDGLDDDLPPEELIIDVQKGATHGWPYCYTNVLGLNDPPQPEVHDTRVTLPSGFTCAQAVPALLTMPAHSAPLGITPAVGSGFPLTYQDDAFAAIHGSWNTAAVNARDCKVERVVVENGQLVRSETFANGWRAPGKPCGDSQTWGRPAGVIFGSDGALYISDDKGNRVYRVVYTGN